MKINEFFFFLFRINLLITNEVIIRHSHSPGKINDPLVNGI